MPKQVEFEGKIHEFPDDATDAEIAAALRSGQSAQQRSQQSSSAEASSKAPRSVGGFVGNVLSSGVKFAADTVKGLPGLALRASPFGGIVDAVAAIKDYKKAVVEHEARGAAIRGHFADRYGSLEGIKRAAYEDPVGVLADVSTVAGIGGAALPGRAGRALATAERITNPLTAPGVVAKGIAGPLSDAVIVSGVRPSAALARTVKDPTSKVRGRQQIAQNIKRERVTTAAKAQENIGASVKEADEILKAEQERVGGFYVGDIFKPLDKPSAALDTDSFILSIVDRGDPHGPITTANRRKALGHVPDLSTEDINSRIEHLFSLGEIPLTEANALKREAQQLAYEMGQNSNTVQQILNETIAQRFRESIEKVVPSVGPINQRTQRLMSARDALAAAEDRPNSLGNMVLGGGIGAEVLSAITGGPHGIGAGIGFGANILNSPRAASRLGIAIDDIGRLLGSRGTHRTALASRNLDPLTAELLRREIARKR